MVMTLAVSTVNSSHKLEILEFPRFDSQRSPHDNNQDNDFTLALSLLQAQGFRS